MTDLLAGFALVVVTVVALEGVATLAHRYIMHGWGWGWHRSHHEPGDGPLERNDLYALVFAALSGGIFVASRFVPALWWVGLGTVVYGVLYFLVHDGLVHQRWPFRHVPRRGYLKRLVQAHRLHHAVQGRDGCVSFGFVYAEPVDKLVKQLQENKRKFDPQALRDDEARAAGE